MNHYENRTNLTIAFVLLALVGILSYGIYQSVRNPIQAEASVSQTSEYLSTTTPSSPAERTLKSGTGTIGQVTITGANTGFLLLFNATTSDVTKRTGQKATSTITIADFPASAAAGTYTFDAQFTDGLLLLTSGNAPTTTITYR